MILPVVKLNYEITFAIAKPSKIGKSTIGLHSLSNT